MVLTPGVEPGPTAYQTVMRTAYTRSGRMRQELNLQGLLGSPGFKPGSVGQSDCASMSGVGRSRTPKAPSGARRFSGPVPSTSRLATPSRMVHGSNVCRALAPAAGFQPGTLPLGQPSMRGRRADRTPVGLTPQPPVSNRVPCHSASLPCGGRGHANLRVPADPHGRDLPASLRAAPGIRTQITHGLNVLALPVGLERLDHR